MFACAVKSAAPSFVFILIIDSSSQNKLLFLWRSMTIIFLSESWREPCRCFLLTISVVFLFSSWWRSGILPLDFIIKSIKTCKFHEPECEDDLPQKWRRSQEFSLKSVEVQKDRDKEPCCPTEELLIWGKQAFRRLAASAPQLHSNVFTDRAQPER